MADFCLHTKKIFKRCQHVLKNDENYATRVIELTSFNKLKSFNYITKKSNNSKLKIIYKYQFLTNLTLNEESEIKQKTHLSQFKLACQTRDSGPMAVKIS
jgi:hypothetical protein